MGVFGKSMTISLHTKYSTGVFLQNAMVFCVWHLIASDVETLVLGISGVCSTPLLPLLTGARGVIVIIVGNGHGDTNSNPGRD